MGSRNQILLYLAIIIAGCAVFDTGVVRGGGITNPATSNLVAHLDLRQPLVPRGVRPL